jgi:hypothetical protein
MTQRPPANRSALPVLDLPPASGPVGPRAAFVVPDARLDEFRPDGRALPSFWIWTLGCQMNRSDSEEMAGRLLAAGCPEALTMETADLVVINTCAIREAAEAKVIGRQGHLARLKAARPGLRVVLTGCAVRERDRAGLARRGRRGAARRGRHDDTRSGPGVGRGQSRRVQGVRCGRRRDRPGFHHLGLAADRLRL